VSIYKNGSDIFRVALDSGVTRRITGGAIGVSGITPTSPAMSMARDTGTLVFSVYRGGGYDVLSLDPATMIDTLVPADGLTGEAVGGRSATASPVIDGAAVVRSAADVSTTGSGFLVRDYRSKLALEGVGQPYISSGGGSFGAFLRGGISFSFDDMLRDRLMSLTLQAGTRLRDLGGRVQYLDRDSRWNWGLVTEQVPFGRGRLSRQRDDGPGQISVETEQLFQIHRELSGVLLYPFNRSERFELRAGVSTIAFERDRQVRTYSRATQRLLHEHETTAPGGDPVRLVLAGAALVHDTSVFGATGPILGQRYRFEAAPAMGDLSYVRLLADYRRYIMPVRPFTIATRLLHIGRYGPGADDPRLEPYFVGYPGLVRGFRARTLRTMICGGTRVEGCNPRDAVTGSRMVVANLEVRFPLFGLFAPRFSYGPWPVEGMAFADAGLAWNGTDTASLPDGSRPLVRSVGAGVRMNAARMIDEVAAARPFGPASSGWTVSLNFGPAF
jgi:hypothetical protein